MKRKILLLLVSSAYLGIFSQSTPKLININKNGVVLYQQRIDSIDSVYFTNLPTQYLVSPANQDTGVWLPVTVSWSTYPGAISYTLQLSTTSDFSSYFYNQTGLTSTSQTITGAATSQYYYWRVMAVTSTYSSQWSSTSRFKTSYSLCGSPTVIYGGQTYHTVQIGQQCWLKENLNIGTMIETGIRPMGVDPQKYCYENNPANCQMYGGLYNFWQGITHFSGSANSSICPSGWHVPSLAEVRTLANYVGNSGNALLAIGQGSGTNSSGFSALLGGYCSLSTYGSNGLGYYARFWSTEADQINSAKAIELYSNYSAFDIGNVAFETGQSIRCIRDTP